MACIHIWGFRGPEAFEPARQAGVALQLTNILRDLKEDAAAGRVYLPLADLRQCGYSLDDLRAGVANDAFLRLMRLEIDRAEQFYRAAGGLWDWLEPDGRRIFGLMTATYRQLLKRIERRPADVLCRRIRLSTFTKLVMFTKWMFFRRLLTLRKPMSGVVGQVANLPGQISNLPHDIAFLSPNKRHCDVCPTLNKCDSRIVAAIALAV
jgi:phytoene/squalene synthetase